jgi:tetratricopeptide (TPR) repeat protein
MSPLLRPVTACLLSLLAQRAPADGAAPVRTEPALQADGGPAPAELKELLSRADAAYQHRDDPNQLDQLGADLVKAELIAPDDFEVLWRLSRYDFWMADDPQLSADARSLMGKKGWSYGDRATTARPDRVEGWFFGAAGVGAYALGIGVLKALSEGIEVRFKQRLEKAQQLDPTFLDGAIENAWGRFYSEAPWPKRDLDESKRHLRLALRQNPANVRARVYLAEDYLRQQHPKDARKLLEEVLSLPAGQYDAPEELRYQARARALLVKLP